ncbi:MAG TPA: hypothetical protein PLR83_05510, partial [Pyrinomonadaceae bacterium]|nr:hypothetical protein [Pyrinomonadaceae bacterium]
YEGAEVSIYYDPMISKFAVYGRDRAEAIDRMRRALLEYQVDGIKTTLPFFREVMNDEVFIRGDLDTGFINGFMERRKAAEPDRETQDAAIIAAALFLQKRNAAAAAANETRHTSRWVSAGRAASTKGI